jgi:hypothetical protein
MVVSLKGLVAKTKWRYSTPPPHGIIEQHVSWNLICAPEVKIFPCFYINHMYIVTLAK